jgi:hypothetical protein
MATSLRTTRATGAQRQAFPGTRFGGPRRPRATHEQTRPEGSFSPFVSDAGSHMPLDTGIHWTWRNPLNIMPAILLLLVVFALLSLVF